MENEDQLLTTEEVADLLRLEPDTLRTWRYRSFGPACFPLGGGKGKRGRIRYRRSVVEAWIAGQEKAGASS